MYETCPHGQRIACADNRVVFIDACGACESLLLDLGFSATVANAPKRVEVSAA